MRIQAIAKELLDAQLSTKQIQLLSDRHPALDVKEAYEIADALRNLRVSHGERVVGRKIGFTNPSLWSVYGVDAPIWGYMYDTTVQPAASTHALSLDRFTKAKIEPEIVFRLSRAPSVGASEAEVLTCVDWVAHGVEIVQSVYPSWKFTAVDAIAAGSLHGALLLGPTIRIAELGRSAVDTLANLSVSIFCDDSLRETGSGSNVLGNPLSALTHLVQVLDAQPSSQPLAAGDIVTTGTLTSAFSIARGERWHTEVSGIGLHGLNVRFA